MLSCVKFSGEFSGDWWILLPSLTVCCRSTWRQLKLEFVKGLAVGLHAVSAKGLHSGGSKEHWFYCHSRRQLTFPPTASWCLWSIQQQFFESITMQNATADTITALLERLKNSSWLPLYTQNLTGLYIFYASLDKNVSQLSLAVTKGREVICPYGLNKLRHHSSAVPEV